MHLRLVASLLAIALVAAAVPGALGCTLSSAGAVTFPPPPTGRSAPQVSRVVPGAPGEFFVLMKPMMLHFDARTGVTTELIGKEGPPHLPTYPFEAITSGAAPSAAPRLVYVLDGANLVLINATVLSATTATHILSSRYITTSSQVAANGTHVFISGGPCVLVVDMQRTSEWTIDPLIGECDTVFRSVITASSSPRTGIGSVWDLREIPSLGLSVATTPQLLIYVSERDRLEPGPTGITELTPTAGAIVGLNMLLLRSGSCTMYWLAAQGDAVGVDDPRFTVITPSDPTGSCPSGTSTPASVASVGSSLSDMYGIIQISDASASTPVLRGVRFSSCPSNSPSGATRSLSEILNPTAPTESSALSTTTIVVIVVVCVVVVIVAIVAAVVVGVFRSSKRGRSTADTKADASHSRSSVELPTPHDGQRSRSASRSQEGFGKPRRRGDSTVQPPTRNPSSLVPMQTAQASTNEPFENNNAGAEAKPTDSLSTTRTHTTVTFQEPPRLDASTTQPKSLKRSQADEDTSDISEAKRALNRQDGSAVVSALSRSDFAASIEGADAQILGHRAWTNAELRRHNRRCQFVRDGAYQKGKLIGRGASGSVYAVLLNDGSTIAMKEVHLIGSDEEIQAQMAEVEQEMDLLSRLHHDNLVTYYGVLCDHNGLIVKLFMENVTGGSIGAMIRALGATIAEETAQRFTKQMLRGLGVLHQAGIIHRDLKCDNVLRDAHTGTVKLADFGTARLLDITVGRSRAAHTMIGTPYFMAPEILAAGISVSTDSGDTGYGTKADIWSLGITVAELQNQGNPPWPAFPSPGHAFLHIANPESEPVMPEGLSEHAQDFIRACTRRDPQARPTARELLEHPWILLAPDDDDDDDNADENNDDAGLT